MSMAAAPSMVFYDGACGLCHRTVRFAIARVRYRLFRKPTDACPVTPPELRARFER